MQFDVYCDESRPDLLCSKNPTAKFMVIGSLWLPTDQRENFKQAIHELRDKYKFGVEFKWQKVSPSRKQFFMELVNWFCQQGEHLRFRCIVVNHSHVDLKLYHNNDQELGFYKFYYQLLHHWILDFNEYSVFVDFKSNRLRDRLPVLKQCLSSSNLSSQVKTVQAVRSHESVLIQLTDLLTGTAAYKLNNNINPLSTKCELLNHLENRLGRKIAPTPKGEQKFNVFQIDLSGGW